MKLLSTRLRFLSSLLATGAFVAACGGSTSEFVVPNAQGGAGGQEGLGGNSLGSGGLATMGTGGIGVQVSGGMSSCAAGECAGAAGNPTGGAGGASAPVCGNGILDRGETCDDGNTKPGDGCSGLCTIEPSYTCPTPGKPCVSSAPVCGNGRLEGEEQCDDGNTVSGDGCSSSCNVEPGYTCSMAGKACVPSHQPPVCGDGIIEAGETCDDSNSKSSDGCSSTCQIESGWRCSMPGQACTRLPACGDGKVDPGEACDDRNTKAGDGCSSTCQLEVGYTCKIAGMPCVSTAVCGNGKVEGSEQCDDGNTKAGDGCTASCTVEPGWICPPGGVCKAAACGDGIIAGTEQCDDGNHDSGDGCTASCTLESPGPTEKDGWVCMTPGKPCTRTTCGNGVREGSEQCDDGNHDSGDGCSPFCRLEPTCPVGGGPCSTACGDGLLLPIDIQNGQQCDDGNTVSADGCSSDCKIEAGYTCSQKPVTQNPLILPIVFRDFIAYGDTTQATQTGGTPHPDFEHYSGSGDPGIVQTQLGANGKPAHVLATKVDEMNQYDGTGKLTSTEDYFASWYKDNATYNRTILQTLTLPQINGGAFQFSSGAGFFPIDNQGWGNMTGQSHNFSFSSEVRYWFQYKGGERLAFTGDDDVWVFLNKKLAVDLGGLHSALDGSVLLDASNGTGSVCDLLAPDCSQPRTVDLGLQVGSVYEAVVFHAERHTEQSNYRLTLSNFNATKSVCVSVCGDGIVTPDEACDLGAAKNTGAYGTCNLDCTLASSCGDGHVQTPPEQCDDGVDGATYGGTSKVCGPGCVYAPYCGDGKVDTSHGEQCDQGAQNSASAYGQGHCDARCQKAPFCGDKSVDGSFGEQCDDGVNSGQAGSCTPDCKAFVPLMSCGNGVKDPGEQCDDGSAKNGQPGDPCDAHCHTSCGNGVKDPGEQCDNGMNTGAYGTCTATCTLAGYCGDGTMQSPPEQCDNGANNQPNPYGHGMCSTQCTTAPYCGDGIVQTAFGEQCDGGPGCTSACKRSTILR